MSQSPKEINVLALESLLSDLPEEYLEEQPSSEETFTVEGVKIEDE